MPLVPQPFKSPLRVEILAPGSRCSHIEEAQAIDYLKSKGISPIWDPESIATHPPHPFHSHEDSVRWHHLKKALYREDTDVIWCLRGGYGSNRLIPHLLKLKKAPKKKKILIGFSDITSLHLFVNQKWNWPSLHGPLLTSLGAGRVHPADEKHLWKILMNHHRNPTQKTVLKSSTLRWLNPPPQLYKSSTFHPPWTETDGVNSEMATSISGLMINGILTGGNLAVLQSHIGTPLFSSLEGKILFLEDIGERGYRIDRMLEQLHQAQLLKGCRAILLGSFTDGEEPVSRERSRGKDTKRRPVSWVSFALQRFAQSAKIPVIAGIPSGHGMRQMALPFGTPVNIQLLLPNKSNKVNKVNKVNKANKSNKVNKNKNSVTIQFEYPFPFQSPPKGDSP